MKILAILFNLLLIGVVIFLLTREGVPNGDDWLFVIPMTLAPIFSLLAIFTLNSNNWLSLYLKRKALEEKQKIDQISGNKD